MYINRYIHKIMYIAHICIYTYICIYGTFSARHKEQQPTEISIYMHTNTYIYSILLSVESIYVGLYTYIYNVYTYTMHIRMAGQTEAIQLLTADKDDNDKEI